MHRTLRRAGVLGILAVALAIAACGGSDAASEGGDLTGGDAANPPTQRLVVTPATANLAVGATAQLAAATESVARRSRDDDGPEDDDGTEPEDDGNGDDDGDDGDDVIDDGGAGGGVDDGTGAGGGVDDGTGTGGGVDDGAGSGGGTDGGTGTGGGGNTTITWRSNDAAVATVDADGLVTAVAPGTATITASLGSLQGHCAVTVTAPGGDTGGGTGGGDTGGGTGGGDTGGDTGGGDTGGGTGGGGGTDPTPSFARDVAPLAAACVCHGSTMRTYSSVSGLVTAGQPDVSPYLVTGSGGNGHPGGDRWGTDAAAVREWILSGAAP